MKPSSEKRLQQLHPALASSVRAVVADLAARGIVVEVVQGLRTYKEQDELYAKGRTKPGPIVTQARGGQSKPADNRNPPPSYVLYCRVTWPT